MKTIWTSKGQAIIVDAEDYEALSQHRWCVNAYGYAVRRQGREIVFMHRQILGLAPGDGMLGDHRDRVRLNNSRENLRIATRSQNQHNRKLRVDSASGVKGVERACGRWKAYIVRNGRKCHLGAFDTIERAQEFRELAAEMLHGEFVSHG